MDTWRTYEWEMESMNEGQRTMAGLESSEKKREGGEGRGMVVAERQTEGQRPEGGKEERYDRRKMWKKKCGCKCVVLQHL